MASAPLKWLLTIGGTALKTTAKTLTDAVNELFDSNLATNKLVGSTQLELEQFREGNTVSLSNKVNKSDVLTLEQIEASTNLTNKVAAASAVGNINESLTASDGLDFNFSTDGEGNYGYLKGDGTFTPFSSGAKIIKLASAAASSFSINVKNYYDGDLSKLTADNFLCVLTNVKISTAISLEKSTPYTGGNNGAALSKSYNATTGVFTASIAASTSTSATNKELMKYSDGSYKQWYANAKSTATTTFIPYLVV
jgi:hypothetical protein